MRGDERGEEVEKWKQRRVREMDEMKTRGSDERGFYDSGTGEARDEIACGRDKKKGKRWSNVIMVKKVTDEQKSEEGRKTKSEGNG